jgi:hypothetical protein
MVMRTLDELIATTVRLGVEEINFDQGERFPAAEWEAAERRMGRWIPESWARFVSEFGAGVIHVRRGSPTSEKPGPYLVSGDIGSVQRDFEIQIAPPAYVEPIDDCFPEGGRDWKNWCRVGGSLTGDDLLLRSERRWKSRPADAELAWLNHEGGGITYRWPGLAELLHHLLEWHASGPGQFLGERARAEARAREPQPASLHPSKPARPNRHGWIQCPHCGIRFVLSDARAWNGRMHLRCRGSIEVLAREDVPPAAPGK